MTVPTRGLDEQVIVSGIDPVVFISHILFFSFLFILLFSREAFCSLPLMMNCALTNLYICWLANGNAKEGVIFGSMRRLEYFYYCYNK